MVIIFVVTNLEDVGCIIVFISGRDLARIEFVEYYEVVSGGIVELISFFIIQDPVRISVVASAVVVGRGVRDIIFTSRAMVGIMVVSGLVTGGVRVII